MPQSDSLRRLGGGRWETRDGRFAIEPQSGTWVIVDNEQADELGLPLVRGPFGSLTAAKEAIEAARTEPAKPSPLAERIEQARRTAKPPPTTSTTKTADRRATAGEPAAADEQGTRGEPGARGGPGTKAASEAKDGVPSKATSEPGAPASPPEPRWLRELEPAGQRRARDLIARLERMGVDGPERVVRAEVADGKPALARLAVERSLAKALAGSKGSGSDAVRAAVRSILGGADVELGVSWRLVDGDDRRIDRVDVPDQG